MLNPITAGDRVQRLAAHARDLPDVAWPLAVENSSAAGTAIFLLLQARRVLSSVRFPAGLFHAKVMPAA